MIYWYEVVMLTLISGLAIPLGGVVSKYLRFKNSSIEVELNHFMVAVVGGALLSAVALVLVPKGSHHLDILSSVLYLGTVGISFMVIDRYLVSKGKQEFARLSHFISRYRLQIECVD